MKSIIRKLYRRWFKADAASMTREQLAGFIPPLRFDDLPKARQKEIVSLCKDLQKNEALKFIIDSYIKDVSDHIIYNAEEGQVAFCRMSINGAISIMERINECANREEEKEEYDKFETI